MEPRLNFERIDREGYRAMINLERHVKNCGLENSLLNLIKVRASQMNRSAFCIDVHTKNARDASESEQRLYVLNAWRETPFFTNRERAALAWTEAVTLINENDVPDELYHFVRQQFSEQELVGLTLAIIMINGWNRLAISFRTVPGSYKARRVETILEHA
jgi:AhpD family alkylhydroperoxidase